MPNSDISGIVDIKAISSSNIWGVGANSDNRSLVEHWDGVKWSIVPIPLPEIRYNNGLGGVASLSATQIVAYGGTMTSSSYPQIFSESCTNTGCSLNFGPNPGLASELNGIRQTFGGIILWGRYYDVHDYQYHLFIYIY